MDVKSYIKPPIAIEDIFVPKDDDAGWIPTDPNGNAFVKPLWTSPESGGWAVLLRWKAGYKAPAHKHLGAIHAFVVSGRLKLRDKELGAGDYIYEANGVIHDETLAVEDTVHLNIADGPVLFFDDNGFNAYFGWEQIEALRQAASA